MTSRRPRIDISREEIADFCRRRRIQWLVDVLVEFEPDVRYTYFTLAQVEEDLSALLGRRADIHMRKTLHPLLRDKVLGQAEALYVGS
jgi:hypothetical protein